MVRWLVRGLSGGEWGGVWPLTGSFHSVTTPPPPYTHTHPPTQSPTHSYSKPTHLDGLQGDLRLLHAVQVGQDRDGLALLHCGVRGGVQRHALVEGQAGVQLGGALDLLLLLLGV
jgi:hypothetical protein